MSAASATSPPSSSPTSPPCSPPSSTQNLMRSNILKQPHLCHRRTESNITNVTVMSDDTDCNCSSNELLELGNNGRYHEGFSALNTPSDGSPRNSNIEIKGEPLKTLLSVMFWGLSMIASTTSLAITHERVPNTTTLPDIILDNIKYHKWGLDVSEVFLVTLSWTAFLVAFFHKHRFIVLRRIFFLIGIHYYYRAITMCVTVLPKPDQNYFCSPTLEDENITTNTTRIIFERVLTLVSGGGLSMNGKHHYCGDYIYSGHTISLITAYLVIKEYSPRKWVLFHRIALVFCIAGIVALLLSRGHYSIDCVIAYWATTRIWWMYHTLAKSEYLKSSNNEDNDLKGMWWWHIFHFFEGRVPAHLPREFDWPIPKRLKLWICEKILKRKNATNSDTSDDGGIESGIRTFPGQWLFSMNFSKMCSSTTTS